MGTARTGAACGSERTEVDACRGWAVDNTFAAAAGEGPMRYCE